MCDRVASEDSFLIVDCPDKYKTQRICDKAVDDSLAESKLIKVKSLKNFLLFGTQMKIYFILIKFW